MSSETARCSRVVLASAFALSSAVIPSLAQAATGNQLAIDTHLATPAHGTAVASTQASFARVAAPAVVADHDNWWIFHNHVHPNATAKTAGSFGEGVFAV